MRVLLLLLYPIPKIDTNYSTATEDRKTLTTFPFPSLLPRPRPPLVASNTTAAFISKTFIYIKLDSSVGRYDVGRYPRLTMQRNCHALPEARGIAES
jgi:hypothetical protein